MAKTDAVQQKITEILTHTLCVDDTEITPGSNLYEDLGADSLDVVEIGLQIEENFGFEVDDAEGDKLKTVQDLYDLIERKRVQ